MNCVELQQSLAEVEDARSPEQQLHLRTCPECVALIEELDRIVAVAAELRAADDPSPRVWNSIEIALRQEGLIRPQGARSRRAAPSFRSRWGRAAWLVPAAAMLLLSVGIYRHNRASQMQAVAVAPAATEARTTADSNDDDLLQQVAENTPAMRSEFELDLRRVNDSIRDAQSAVNESPNDEDARRALMDAYQQKSMLYEMAMDSPQR